MAKAAYVDQPFPKVKAFASLKAPKRYSFAKKPQAVFSDAPKEGYTPWLAKNFPHVASSPMGPRHIRLWNWFDGLKPGEKPRARVEPWPRGGGKSTTGQLGVCYVGCKLSRRFALIVSETQDQADKLVQSISDLFEEIGMDRSLNKYGYSKGWKANILRCANGFSVMGLGLDGAVRGIKLGKDRPDLIVFDDFDNQHDSPRAVKKKAATIKASIIPAGATDVALLFLQNLIHENGIMTSLVRGTADFLLSREVAVLEPAVRGLETARELQPDGSMLYRVTGGTPTWAGQSLVTVEEQINDQGLATFLRESQHEVEGADGLFFDTAAFRFIDAEELPAGMVLCRGWDLGATQKGGDPTAGALLGRAPGIKTIYVLDVKREFYASNDVKDLEKRTAEADASAIVYEEDEKLPTGKFLRAGGISFVFKQPKGSVKQRFPQDPGQAGKAQANDIREGLDDHLVKTAPVRRKKARRWTRWQAAVNVGNVVLVRAPWNKAFVDEHRMAREDEEHEHDDQIDGASDAYEEVDPVELGGTESAYVPSAVLEQADDFDRFRL